MHLNTIESKLTELENLLSSQTLLWQNEILHLHLQDRIPQAWLCDDFYLNFADYQYFDNTSTLPHHHPLHALSVQLHEACSLPDLCHPNFQYFTPLNSLEIKAKKQHEITQLLHHIKQSDCFHQGEQLVDLAGGKGHLSRVLQHYFVNLQLHRCVLDSNKNFAQSNDPFYCVDLLKVQSLPVPQPDHLLLLHGCGALTDQAIDFYSSHQTSSLHLVSCCYHLIQKNFSFTSYPLIKLTSESLHLATRTYKVLDATSWKKRHNVKQYRYTFEMWFFKKFRQTMPALKSSPGKLYESTFENYCDEQLKRLQIAKTPETIAELNSLFEKEFDLREKLIRLGMLRHLFSRPLEVYLSLRRAKELLKANQESTLEFGEIFDKKISPRNILISAKRR